MSDAGQEQRSGESLGFAWAAFFVAICAFVAAIASFGFAAVHDKFQARPPLRAARSRRWR